MELETGTPLRFIVMRPEILADKELTQAEKLVYARICGFDEYFESSEQCAALLGLGKDTVRKAKIKLVKHGYIAELCDTGHGKKYSPILDGRCAESAQEMCQNCTPDVPNLHRRCAKSAHIEEKENNDTKVSLDADASVENSNKTEKAEEPEEFGKHEINSLMEYMEAETHLPCKRDKRNRYACNTLLKKYGEDGVRKLIKGVVEAQNDRYAPHITNFVQLRDKLAELLLWGKQRGNEPSAKLVAKTDSKSEIQRLYGERKGQTYEEALAMVQRERENN